MSKLFIDTNILIDLIMRRDGYIEAAKILSLYDKGKYSLHASVLTMANLAYVLRKVIGKDRLYRELLKFDSILHVESLTKLDYANAISLKAKDFEDALQYECAKSSGCQTIITRNKKDYNFEGIEVLSPKEFLALS